MVTPVIAGSGQCDLAGRSIAEGLDCARTRSLELRKGNLRFPSRVKSHDKRKMYAPVTSQRRATRETIGKSGGGESK